MHKEILNNDQLDLLQFLKSFRREFYLVGGTAVALHIGHRRSIDYDLFKTKPLNHKSILQKLDSAHKSYLITRRVEEQLNIIVQNVKFTFFQYPFSIIPSCEFERYIRVPDLLTLAAMKAYALGRRSKWKDYVDLFFIIRDYFSIKQVSDKAATIFDDLFSEKQFRSQLSYYDDIDYSEQIDYIIPEVSINEIKAFLIEKATDIF
jgi:hypothetical protein